MIRTLPFAVLAAVTAIAASGTLALAQSGSRSGGWREPTLSVTLGACRNLVAHHPAPDVAYQPGVDVEGRRVAPADLPGSGNAAVPGFGDVIIIPLSVELGRRFGLPVGRLPIYAEAEIGVVVVQGDRVMLNGQPLTSEGEATLARICRDRVR